MRYRSFAFVMTACLCGALLAGCAGGGSSATRAPGAIPAAGQSAPQLPGGAVRRPESAPQCSGTGSDSFVGGGIGNAAEATISGVLEGESNYVCDPGSAIADGFQNLISSGASTSYYSFIGAGSSNTITGSGYQSVIGGGNVNLLSAPNSVIGGGNQNTLSGSGDSVITGGSLNQISAQYAFVGGGLKNQDSGEYGFVGGGYQNNISAQTYGFIGAGVDNKLSGEGAVVVGGYANTGSGAWATIPGGEGNVASGVASFAAGNHADATKNGAFVWSDGSDGDTALTSTAAYQFLARASGGFTLWTNAASTVGARLAPGSGTWASASDRNMKTNVARLDDADVLDKVSRLPISKWSYVTERGVRHVGPMAQDFYAAFGVGADDKHITSIDEDGVALAAIKALHAENASLRARQARLQAMTSSQAAQIAALKASQSQHDLLVQRQLQRLSTVVFALRVGSGREPTR
jgi:hypothetical protein